MNEYELIDSCRNHLNHAESAKNDDDHKRYYQAMSKLLDLLMVELVSNAPNKAENHFES